MMDQEEYLKHRETITKLVDHMTIRAVEHGGLNLDESMIVLGKLDKHMKRSLYLTYRHGE